MSFLAPFRDGFLDELEKIAAGKYKKETRKGWASPSSRSGRRPMRVSTLLRKEKDGTLGGYKLAQLEDPTMPTFDDELLKTSSAAFFDELEKIAAAGALSQDLLEKAAELDVEGLLKEALSLPGMGALGGALGKARGGIAQMAGKVSPVLNKPVMQAAQQGAHALQHSNNRFLQGVGQVAHHKAQTPGKMFLAAANPVGTAAEALTAGAGHVASHGLSRAGAGLQRAVGAGDDLARAGRAMTPKGRLMNAAERLGGGMQQTFSRGGVGHKVLTEHLPVGAEIGGAVGAGLALHAPVGLAGALGKAGLVGAGKVAPALGAALDHAPGAVDAIANKVTPALKGVGGALGHAAEDVLGTKGQAIAQRLGARGAMQQASEHLPKMAGVLDKAKALGGKALHTLHKYEDPIEVAGLGVLAAPGIDSMVARHRALKAGLGDGDGHVSEHDTDKYRLIKERFHDPVDVGGLGVLTAPLVAKRLVTGSWTGH